MKFFSSLWKTFVNDKLLQKVIKNASYLLSSNVISMGLSMMQSILVGRLLGVAGFGVIATITAFASMLNRLFSFRMNELVVKYFGEATLQDRPERAAAVIKAAALGETISAILSFIVIILLAPIAATKLADDAATTNLFILYGTMVLANFATETSTGVLQVRNMFKNQAVINLISSAMTASIIVWAFIAKKGMLEIMAAYLVGKFVLGLGTAALGWHEMQKEFGSGWLRTSFDNLPPFKELFGFAFSTNISSTIIMLVRDNEALWIAWFLSPIAVGYAKTALAIINLVQIPITPFIATTYPEINAAVTRKDWPLLRQLLKRITLISGGWTGITAVGLVIFGRWLLGFYGADFQPAYIPMLLFLAGLGFANIFFWNRPLLLSLGLPMVPYRISLWCGIAKIALAVLLVPKLGLNFEAILLSLFFIISVSWIILRGWQEVKKMEALPHESIST
jgi:O-antigen/teichoic acid export membrane protein